MSQLSAPLLHPHLPLPSPPLHLRKGQEGTEETQTIEIKGGVQAWVLKLQGTGSLFSLRRGLRDLGSALANAYPGGRSQSPQGDCPSAALGPFQMALVLSLSPLSASPSSPPLLLAGMSSCTISLPRLVTRSVTLSTHASDRLLQELLVITIPQGQCDLPGSFSLSPASKEDATWFMLALGDPLSENCRMLGPHLTWLLVGKACTLHTAVSPQPSGCPTSICRRGSLAPAFYVKNRPLPLLCTKSPNVLNSLNSISVACQYLFLIMPE